MTLGIQAKEFNLGFIRTRESYFSWSESPLGAFDSPFGVCLRCLLLSGFCLATLPESPDWCCAAEIVGLLEGSPITAEEL